MLSGTFLVSLGLGGAFVLSLFFAMYCVKALSVRGAVSLSVLFIGISVWIAADIIQLLTPATATPLVGTEFRFLGPDITVIGLFLFSLEYTGRAKYPDPFVPALLAIKPLGTAVVLLTPYREQLVGVSVPSAQYGYEFASSPLYLGYLGYNWTLTILAIGFLAHMLLRTSLGYQRQITAMIAGLSLPFLVNILFHFRLTDIDLTSSAFLLTAMIFTYASFRLRLLDALPVARQTVLEEMEEMVLVLDETDRIVTANAAARAFFASENRLAGQPAAEVFGFETVADLEAVPEVRIENDGVTYYLDVTTSKITDYRENQLATVVVLRDVTEHHKRERQLREREEELALLKDLQSRFLRHNLRNELNVVRSNAQFLVDTGDPEQEERFEQLSEKTDRILDLGSKARVIEQLVEREKLVIHDASQLVETLVEEFRDRYPNVEFDLSLDRSVDIRAVPQVDKAVENVLENALEHNDSDQPRVWVTVERDDGSGVIRVRDNGPGIDQHERDAIDQAVETPLQHGSGFGLWVIYWVLNKSHGDLSIEVDDGTVVELRFETA